MYRVYKKGNYPKPKKDYYKNIFISRQKARVFCRNRNFEEGLVIVHPDKSEEVYAARYY